MNRTWRDFDAKPGDKIVSTHDLVHRQGESLWWLVLGSTPDSLIVAFCSPFHQNTSHFPKGSVEQIPLSNDSDGYGIVRKEDYLT
jgi:hypothetical protein